MPWIKPNLVYYDAGDVVAEGSAKCAVSPLNHTLTDNWQDDPMDPAVCWREKTAQEIDDEKTVEAIKLRYPVRAFKAVLEILYANSAELQSAYATVNDFIQACVDNYKSKL